VELKFATVFRKIFYLFVFLIFKNRVIEVATHFTLIKKAFELETAQRYASRERNHKQH